MQNIPFIQGPDIESKLTWHAVSEALYNGHCLKRANIDDILFKQGDNAVLNRAAWVPGAGIGIKTATIFPGNLYLSPPKPSIHAIFTLFNDETGAPEAIIDGDMVTKWKTVGDSMLAAQLLARSDSKNLLIVGAGTVAASLIDAYRDIFPSIENVHIWNRTYEKAEKLAQEKDALACKDLQQAVGEADIIAAATMSTEAILKGGWIKPGTHVDLIGAYRPDMREADDELIAKGSLYVDARETTLHDIGELIMPLESGAIGEDDIKGDYYDLCQPPLTAGDTIPQFSARKSDQEITIFKNGGGAHLDLMTALYIKSQFEVVSG